MAFKSDLHDEVMAEINVVPLVDVILVVLIIFMVTAPMIMKPSIGVSLPKAGAGDATAASKLDISISQDGQLNLGGRAASDEQVKASALEMYQKNPEIQAIISADKSVPHGRVVSVLDIVKSVGVKKFAISIDRK